MYIINERESKASLYTHDYDLFCSRLHTLQILLGASSAPPSALLSFHFSIQAVAHRAGAGHTALSQSYIFNTQIRRSIRTCLLWNYSIGFNWKINTQSNSFSMVLWLSNIFFHLKLLLIYVTPQQSRICWWLAATACKMAVASIGASHKLIKSLLIPVQSLAACPSLRPLQASHLLSMSACLIPAGLSVSQEWTLPSHKSQPIPRRVATPGREPSVSCGQCHQHGQGGRRRVGWGGGAD